MDTRFDKLEAKIDKVTEDVAEVKINLVRQETELKSEIKVLNGKIDGIGKRLDQTEFINRGLISTVKCRMNTAHPTRRCLF